MRFLLSIVYQLIILPSIIAHQRLFQPSYTSVNVDYLAHQNEYSVPEPSYIQFIGCITFSGFQQLLIQHGVKGIEIPTRDGCILLCRNDQPFGLAYFSPHSKSCYCAPKEEHPLIEWVAKGLDAEGNCGGLDDVSVDYLNIPWIFHGCYTSLWSAPYHSEIVYDPVYCVESCQSSDGSLAMLPKLEEHGWLCACFREPTEGVLGRQCGPGVWQGYHREWINVDGSSEYTFYIS